MQSILKTVNQMLQSCKDNLTQVIEMMENNPESESIDDVIIMLEDSKTNISNSMNMLKKGRKQLKRENAVIGLGVYKRPLKQLPKIVVFNFDGTLIAGENSEDILNELPPRYLTAGVTAVSQFESLMDLKLEDIVGDKDPIHVRDNVVDFFLTIKGSHNLAIVTYSAKAFCYAILYKLFNPTFDFGTPEATKLLKKIIQESKNNDVRTSTIPIEDKNESIDILIIDPLITSKVLGLTGENIWKLNYPPPSQYSKNDMLKIIKNYYKGQNNNDLLLIDEDVGSVDNASNAGYQALQVKNTLNTKTIETTFDKIKETYDIYH